MFQLRSWQETLLVLVVHIIRPFYRYTLIRYSRDIRAAYIALIASNEVIAMVSKGVSTHCAWPGYETGWTFHR